MPNIHGLEVIAQIAVGLAGFSGVMVAVAKPSVGFNKVERFRLRSLIYGSFGAMFLAILPFAVFGGPWAESSSWRALGAIMTIYTIAGLSFLPAAGFRLRREHPEQVPRTLIAVQVGNHVITLLLALAILFGLTDHQASAYTLVLILLLVQGAIAFVRVLFYRRD